MAEKIPATGKWEGGSKDPGRLANEQLGDNEFGIAIAPYMDPDDRQFINPQQAKLVGLREPATMAGTNRTGMKKSRTLDISPSMHPQGKSELTLEPGSIYAMHASDANPALWSHEFRHDSPSIEARFGESEDYNRYEDVYHAQTETDDELGIEYLADLLYRQSGKESSAKLDDYGQAAGAQRGYWEDQARKLLPSILQQMETHHKSRDQQRPKDERVMEILDRIKAKRETGAPDEKKRTGE